MSADRDLEELVLAIASQGVKLSEWKPDYKVCPSCFSRDVVGYWTIKRPPPSGVPIGSAVYECSLAIYKELYPNAKKCVDCEHVFW